MTQNYTLNIISHHPEFVNKTLKKYSVEGIETVGAYGNEKFSIVFKNNTYSQIAVVISLDGTNILTGKTASTETAKDSYMVGGYGTLTLNCWQENDFGGSAFVFTNAENGVATHTHGDLSSQGIIAAAVFVEGNTQTYTINNFPIVITQPVYYPWQYPYVWGNQFWDYQTISYTTNSIFYDGNVLMGNTGMSSGALSCSMVDQNSLQNNAAVGAGEYTEQKINYTAGLIKPVFSEVVRVRYLWWDQLKEKLVASNFPSPHATGFPADTKKANFDLSAVPKVGSHKKIQPISTPNYSRI